MRIALLGAGAIGVPLGMRILQAGYSLSVYNRTPNKTDILAHAGARVDHSCHTLLADAQLVISTLTDIVTLEEVIRQSGAIKKLARNTCIIDCSTSLPQQLRAFEMHCREQEIGFVAAPLAGSVHDVSHGTVTFIVGGDVSALETVRPVLLKLGRQMISFGSVEAAGGAKLALNILVGLMAVGLGEVLGLCQAGAVDPGLFFQVLAGSGLASPLYERLGARYQMGDFAARFALKHLQKDLQYAEAWGESLAASHETAMLASRLIASVPAEYLQKDYSILSAYFAQAPVSSSSTLSQS